MQLYCAFEMPDDAQGLVCRQSRLAGVVRLVVFSGLVFLFPFFGWKLDKPWLLWIGVGLSAVVVAVAARDLAKQFQPANWLLRIGSDCLWINLRSYRDRALDPDAPSVVRLDYGEIAHVGRHTECYSTPSESTSLVPTIWKDDFLEIELNHDQTGDLKRALNDLRFPQQSDLPPSDSIPPGQMPDHPCVSTVWFVNPSVLRIAWYSGHGTVIAPGLTQALSELETWVRVDPPTRRERPNFQKLTPQDATVLARELVQVHGDTFAAARLLNRSCGMTLGQANTQVQQFEAEAIA